MKNGINRFRDWSLIRDIRLTDVLNGRKIKQDVIEFVEYCKNKKPNGLKRHTIRTYLKQVKYFMEWLSDEDFGKGSISVNPISSDFIKKVYPPNPMEKKGLPRRNVYFTMDGYDEMWDVCVKKVRGLWNDFIENGWSKTHSNQPLGVGSDVVFFVSLLQLDSGFRVGELLTSFRNLEYHENRRDKKNSSTYWEWKDGEWYGQGTVTWPSGKFAGDKYVGEWKDSRKHGQGTYTFSDGDEYVGGWKKNKMHGQGTFTRVNGDTYKGIWKKGKLVKRN